ncbi:MAG: hypothetical protein K2I43_03410, partial [Alistipes sp.]|nr:hypothetical protein [Alistipes sp.]
TEEELRWRKSTMQPQRLHRQLRYQYIWLAAVAAFDICAAATAKWELVIIVTMNGIAPVLSICSTRRMIADTEEENTDI